VILPFMPWPSYASWSRDGLHAVWLYLRSLKPISHNVPASTLAGVAANATGRPRGQAIYGVFCQMCVTAVEGRAAPLRLFHSGMPPETWTTALSAASSQKASLAVPCLFREDTDTRPNRGRDGVHTVVVDGQQMIRRRAESSATRT
jgi:hypothetical protein